MAARAIKLCNREQRDHGPTSHIKRKKGQIQQL